MPYFAVHSGNVFRCVLADDAESACVEAVKLHMQDAWCERCEPGQLFATAELGQSAGDKLFILAKRVASSGGFQVVAKDD